MSERFAKFRIKYILLSIIFYFFTSIVASSFIEEIKNGTFGEKITGWLLILFFLFGACAFFARAFPFLNFLDINEFGFKYRTWPFTKSRKWSECTDIKLTHGSINKPTQDQIMMGQDKFLAFEFTNPTFFERLSKKTNGFHFAITENYNQNNYDLIKQIKAYQFKNKEYS